MATKSPQHRPPQDMLCPMLPLVTGCTHGKCRFCDIFIDVPFAPLPQNEIEASIEKIARTATALTRRIYLTGGNPFALPTDRLLEVFDMVEDRIPTVRSYGGFCRIADVARKSDRDLARLAARGVNDVAIGAESGFDQALAFMKKGHVASDIVKQGQRLHRAGIDFTFFYLAGMAGAGCGRDNALASARVFSAAAPRRILVVTMTPTRTWPLRQDIAQGRWRPASETETAREIQTFVGALTCHCFVNCSHDTDIIRFEGLVPHDQDNMVKLMDVLIPKMNETAARRVREALHNATFQE